MTEDERKDCDHEEHLETEEARIALLLAQADVALIAAEHEAAKLRRARDAAQGAASKARTAMADHRAARWKRQDEERAKRDAAKADAGKPPGPTP